MRNPPSVAVAGADLLLLDLMGCGPALGRGTAGCDEADAARLVAADLVPRLARRGFTARTAAGASPDMAAALARFGASDPLRLPVAALALGEDATRGLRRAGLRTLADLADRPMAPLAARFGTALPGRLARLLGREDSHIVPHRAVPAIHVERRFAEPMATVAPLMGVIAGLAGEAAALLAERGAGGRTFAVALFRTDGHVARLEVASGRPLRDPAAIARLFAERLDSLADPLDPGFGYDMVRLAVPATERLAPAQGALTHDSAARADMGDLIDRLRVRFGAASLARLAPRDAHLPEWAAAAVPPEAGEAAPWPVPEPGEPPLRPLFLYDPPQRVTVIAEVPDGPPRRFAWRGRQHRVVRQEGPERIAWPWWKKAMTASDGAEPAPAPPTGPTRDYYRVEDADGHRFWLFRHGLYGSEAADPGWYIHGLFA